MKLIGLTGSRQTSAARRDRSTSLGGLYGKILRAVAQPWRWAPVLALPLLFVEQGGGWPSAHPPPDEVAVTAPRTTAALPLRMNARVEKWVHRFRSDQRPLFQHLLDQEGVYGNLIRTKLRQRGMPEDLLYLAMMESGLSPRAVSDASAVGIWQLMVPTALQYGLRIDDWVDERRDPVRATDAALDYLQSLHERYDSWYLAAAAYNAGPSRVDRALDLYADGRSGKESLYWQVIAHLPPETRNYVPRMLAATYLAQYADAFGFTTTDVTPYRYSRVFVPGGTSLSRVAHTLQIGTSVLRSLNPQLIRGVTPPGETYPVRVPVGTAGIVVASLSGSGHRHRAD